MYSNKENVNLLTALLMAYGVRHAVVCPGSRNAPIVHNFNECPEIECFPVTDERSAGFFAVGMMQALDAPVAVCVTSGTALLNLMPAVAEAWYQHLPLVVISADRPPQWIGQLDGQTLPQPGALGGFVRRSVSLPEPPSARTPLTAHTSDDTLWYCRRLICEALLDATTDDPRPVHINVPITEPLFTFDVPQLPVVNPILRKAPAPDYDCLYHALVDGLLQAQRPMIVFGQASPHHFEGCGVDHLFSRVIVLHEALAPFPHVSHFDEVLYREEQRASDKDGGDDRGQRLLPPDFIIYVGDTIVSKRLRRFLRLDAEAQTWRISNSGDVEDTFQNLRGIIVGDPETVLQSLSQKISFRKLSSTNYRRQWLAALTSAATHAADYQPDYSQMAAVRLFEQKLSGLQAADAPVAVHYANSSVIRLANIYAAHHVWCNRGVNGIEGSLSAAVGFAVAQASLTAHRPSCVPLEASKQSANAFVFCVIGDLSFFYDQNALWNQNLNGGSTNGCMRTSRLRILLLNNGRGGIFNQLPGLEQSPARDRLVAAAHQTSAEGICLQNNVMYMKAESMQQLASAIDTLFDADTDRPVLLEVFTDAAEDARVLKTYYYLLP